MKIFFLSFPYIPFGGQGRIVRDLAFGLVEEGHELSLLCLDSRGAPRNDTTEEVCLEFPGEKISIADHFVKYRSYWRSAKERGGFVKYFAVLRLLFPFLITGIRLIVSAFWLAKNKEVLMGHGQYESAFVAFLQICLPKKRRTIWVIHASVAGYLSSFERFFLFPFFKKLDVIVVLSRAEKAYFVEYGIPQEKIRIIPNGIDAKNIPILAENPLDSETLEFLENDPYIVCVSRLIYQKDQSNLLHAFGKLHSIFPDLKLLFVGEGELQKELEDIVSDLQLWANVRFVGAQENPFPYMAKAIAHVLASRYEWFGLVHAEALLLECPVIASDVPTGPREILSGLPCPSDRFIEAEYGILVPKESSDVLAEAIEYLIAHHKKFERKAQSGRIYVEMKYNLKTMIKEYDRVIKGK